MSIPIFKSSSSIKAPISTAAPPAKVPVAKPIIVPKKGTTLPIVPPARPTPIEGALYGKFSIVSLPIALGFIKTTPKDSNQFSASSHS